MEQELRVLNPLLKKYCPYCKIQLFSLYVKVVIPNKKYSTHKPVNKKICPECERIYTYEEIAKWNQNKNK